MAELTIHEHTVEPTCNWTTVIVEDTQEKTDVCAHKITFDRAYPFIWVILRSGTEIGTALTKEDVERAVIEDEETQLKDFDLSVDGVILLNTGQAFCIACGARNTLYLLQKNGGIHALIAAQDDPICPLTQIYGWT